MSFIPFKTTESLKSSEEKIFLGLDRSENCTPNHFLDMKNLSCNCYPYLSNRAPREKSENYNTVYIDGVATDISQLGEVRAVLETREDTTPAGFCGVIGTKFYYNGKEKKMKVPAVYDTSGKFKYGMDIDSTGIVQLLWANRVVVIHGYGCNSRKPYVYYYNTDDEGKSPDYVQSTEYKKESNYTERTISVSVTDGIGTIEFITKENSGYKGGHYDFKVGDSIFIDELMVYADSRWQTLSNSDITSAVVTYYDETLGGVSGGNYSWTVTLKIKFYNHLGKSPITNSFSTTIRHIYKKIPYMTHLTLHKGRLWGANPNGEYVYASALGDLFDFNRFDGVNDNSVYLESSSQGGYIGVVSVGEMVVALKQNEFEAIYGELPDEFAVGKRYMGYGCTDIYSCTVIDNALYFLGNRGFYVWNGSRPQFISKPLDCLYSAAFGFSDGIKYYVSAKRADGSHENLAFDPRYGLWHKEDDCKISGYFRRGRKNFILVEGKNIKALETGSEEMEWYAESGKFFFDDYEQSRVNELLIRAKLTENTIMEVEVAADDGKWQRCAHIRADKAIPRTYRVPVRLDEGSYWRFRISGKGSFLIYGIKVIRDRGGRNFSNERIE